MTRGLPRIYFRIRENGAAVFRVDPETSKRRLELQQIATVSTRSGEIRPQGTNVPTQDEMNEISKWLAERQQTLAARADDAVRTTIEHINLTASWVQKDATNTQLDAVTDDLLLAMHDLRSLLVRKMADRLEADDDPAASSDG